MDNNTRTKTDWLKKLADNPDLWEERAYSEIPAVIAHEYERLHDLALQNNVYGVMLQIKDVYEIVLKYPCILALCIFRRTNSPEGMAAYDALMAKILEKVISFGDWRDKIANPLLKLKEYLPTQLASIMEKTYAMITSNFVGKEGNAKSGIDIINWRNNNIGHGALRLAEDDSLTSEIQSMLEKLKEYFGTGSKISICGQYDNIVLMQGERSLVGAQATDLKDDLSPFSLVIRNDAAFPIPFDDLKYILPYENKICFFDTYINNKQKSKYLDYVAGCLNFRSRDFFYELYKKLEQDGKIQKTQTFSKIVTDTGMEKLLSDLNKTDYFQKPDYVYKWMEETLQQNGKGCYMLRMGRGMGKSTLSSYLDGRYSRKDEARKNINADCIIRTYHCSRNLIRGINDFIMSLNSIFLEADCLDGYIKDVEGIFKTIRRDEPGNKARATADLLNSYGKYFQQAQGKDIVLVIDGVDEIMDKSIFDYFPAPSDLDEGVYIFYTSRPNEELPAYMCRLIDAIRVQEVYTVTANNKGYQKLVLEYTKKELERNAAEKKTQHGPKKDNAVATCKILTEKAGFNFLKLRLLIPVYCSGNDMDAAALETESAMFEHFLNLLNKQYGEKYYQRYLKPLLINLAIFYDGLTFDELSKLMDDMNSSLMLFAMLNDLKGVLSVERSIHGNLYLLANEEYIHYVRAAYAQDILSTKQCYMNELLEAAGAVHENFGMDEIMQPCPSIETYITQTFPKSLMLREKIFHITDLAAPALATDSSHQTAEKLASISPRNLLKGNVTDLDFLHEFLLLSQSVGYGFYAFKHSVKNLLRWAQEYIFYLSKYSQLSPNFAKVGEKIAWCFAYLRRMDEPCAFMPNADSEKYGAISSTHFIDMFRLHIEALIEKQIINDSLKLFRLIAYGGFKAFSARPLFHLFFRHVIQKKEFPLFLEHEEELFSIICRQIVISVHGLSNKYDSILPEYPNATEWQAWEANMKLNLAINLFNQEDEPHYMQWMSFFELKEYYALVIAAGGTPRYIPYMPTDEEHYKDAPYFYRIVSLLKNDNREGYLEMRLQEAAEEENSLAVFDLCMILNAATEDECKKIADLCLRKCTERKAYLENCLEQNLPLKEELIVELADENIISHYLAAAFPDGDFDYAGTEEPPEFIAWAKKELGMQSDEETKSKLDSASIEERLWFRFSYKYRWNPQKHAKKLKRWLDRYAPLLLPSKTHSCIYFTEFRKY